MGNVKRHMQLAASNDAPQQAKYLDRNLSWSERLRLARAAREDLLGDTAERRVLPVQKPWETEAGSDLPPERDDDGLDGLAALSGEDPETARKSIREKRADLIAQFAAQSQPQPPQPEPQRAVSKAPDPGPQTPQPEEALPAAPRRVVPATSKPRRKSRPPLIPKPEATPTARPITTPLTTGIAASTSAPRRSVWIWAVLILALLCAAAAVVFVMANSDGAVPSAAAALPATAAPLAT